MQCCYHALDAMHLTGGWTCFLLYFNTSVFWMFEVVCVRFFLCEDGCCHVSRLMLSSRSTLNAMVVTSYWVEVEYLLLRWFEVCSFLCLSPEMEVPVSQTMWLHKNLPTWVCHCQLHCPWYQILLDLSRLLEMEIWAGLVDSVLSSSRAFLYLWWEQHRWSYC